VRLCAAHQRSRRGDAATQIMWIDAVNRANLFKRTLPSVSATSTAIEQLAGSATSYPDQ
jgi:hypothetical protein